MRRAATINAASTARVLKYWASLVRADASQDVFVRLEVPDVATFKGRQCYMVVKQQYSESDAYAGLTLTDFVIRLVSQGS